MNRKEQRVYQERLERRIRRYDAGMRQWLPSDYPESKLSEALRNYAVAAAHQMAVEYSVRQLLADTEVPVICLMYYLVYARSIDRLLRQDLSVAELETAVLRLTRKWTERGLDGKVLKDIRREVFGIE